MGWEDSVSKSPTWLPRGHTLNKGKWPLLHNHTSQFLPESLTLASLGVTHCRFRLGAAGCPLCSKLNRTRPPGLRRADQKSLPLRVMVADFAE